jgi:hypothetical protein
MEKMRNLCVGLSFSVLIFTGCQQTPKLSSTPASSSDVPVKETGIPTPDGVVVTPYDRPDIIREKLPTVATPKTSNNTKTSP